MNYYLITGGSSGIGKALIELLTERADCRIFNFSRTKTIKHQYVENILLDLSTENGIIQACQYIEQIHFESPKQIVLINNAATLHPIALVGKQENSLLFHHHILNVLAPQSLSNTLINKCLQIDCKKQIVHISSGAAHKPIQGWAAYCSAKAALEMHAAAINAEKDLQQHPFHALAIAPGVVQTNMQTTIRQQSQENLPSVERFIDLFEKDLLFSPTKAASLILEVIENKKYENKTSIDVREI